MILTLEFLRRAFLPLELKIIRGCREQELYEVRALGDDFRNDPTVLYIGKTSQLPADASGVTCALVSDEPLPSTAGNNVLLFDETVSVDALLSIGGDFFSGMPSFHRKAYQITSEFVAGGSIEAIVNAAYVALGRSILLGDCIFKTLAVSPDFEEELKPWEEFIELGYAPSFSDGNLDNKDKWRISAHGMACRIINRKLGGYDVMIEIECDGRLSAHLLVICGKTPLTIWEEAVLGVMCDTVSAKLTAERDFKANQLTYLQFITHILEGDLDNWEMIRLRANYLGINPEGYFSLLLIKATEYHPILKSISTLRETLASMFGTRPAIVRGNDIVLLQRYDAEKDYYSFDTRQISEFLEVHSLCGSRSKLFFRLKDMRRHFIYTKKITDLGLCLTPERRFYSDDDLGIFAIVNTLLCAEDKEGFMDPNILKLAEIDEQNNTSHVKTLHTYLKHWGNTRLTCDELGIHRNTLDYRIEKIKALTHIDLTTGNCVFRLYLSLSILWYLQNKGSPEPGIKL